MELNSKALGDILWVLGGIFILVSIGFTFIIHWLNEINKELEKLNRK